MPRVAPDYNYFPSFPIQVSEQTHSNAWKGVLFLAHFDKKNCSLISKEDSKALEKAKEDDASCCFACFDNEKTELVTSVIFEHLNLLYEIMAASLLTYYEESLEIPRVAGDRKGTVITVATSLIDKKEEILKSLECFFTKREALCIFKPVKKAAEDVIRNSTSIQPLYAVPLSNFSQKKVSPLPAIPEERENEKKEPSIEV